MSKRKSSTGSQTTKETAKKTKAPKQTAAPKRSTPGDFSVDEDRGHVRVPVQLLVDYRCEGHYLFDFCRDLGAGGVFIETKTPLELGSKLDLTFTIPDSKQTLNTNGTVIWVQPMVEGRADLTPGMGIQFTGFNSGQRGSLEEFVKRYSVAVQSDGSTKKSA